MLFFFSSRRRHTRCLSDWSSDVCSSDLFLGFSFFLIVAALLLMALLFQFGIEQRAAEIGTLLALGFTPKLVRRLLLLRSEERRVGKECRSMRSPDSKIKNRALIEIIWTT